MKTRKNISLGVLLAATAGGLFVGYADLTASEVQGSVLILMIVTFLCAVSARAPGWLIAIVAASGLLIMHSLAALGVFAGYGPNAGMLIAVVPALIGAYGGVLVRFLLDAAAEALGYGDSDDAVERPLIVFAGLALCTLAGLPMVHNVLAMGSDIRNDWFVAFVWQIATLVAWCGIAFALALDYERRQRSDTPNSLRPDDLLRHGAIVVGGAIVHTIALFILARILLLNGPHFILSSTEADRFVRWYVFLAYLPLDALSYLTIQLLIYATDRERADRENARRTAELNAALDQSRLAALNAQLRPHFLFNALNSVVVLARRGDSNGADEAATSLADLMRYVLNSESGTATITEELAFAAGYMKLEQIRFSDRLNVRIESDDDIRAMQVPRLLLQPLVENAVRHGIARQRDGGHIRVSAHKVGGAIELSVQDDGPGMTDDAHREEDGLGLRATRSRLRTIYDGKATLELIPVEPHGVNVRIRIPRE